MILWLPGDRDFFLRIRLSLYMDQDANLPSFCFRLFLWEEIAVWLTEL